MKLWLAIIPVMFSLTFLISEVKAQSVNCPTGSNWCACVARSGFANNAYVAPTYNRLCRGRATGRSRSYGKPSGRTKRRDRMPSDSAKGPSGYKTFGAYRRWCKKRYKGYIVRTNSGWGCKMNAPYNVNKSRNEKCCIAYYKYTCQTSKGMASSSFCRSRQYRRKECKAVRNSKHGGFCSLPPNR